MNYNSATRAREALESVMALRSTLQDLYATPARNLSPAALDKRGSQIADAHQSIGVGLKVAHVWATLAIAEAIQAGGVLDGQAVVHALREFKAAGGTVELGL